MPTNDKLTILACQISIPAMTRAAERDAHLAASVGKVRARLRASDTPVDLVVLPELSSIDYSRETFARLDDLAEPLDGASFQAWRQVAIEHGVSVSFGFARAGEGGPFICTGVVGPDGQLVGHYDKLHLAQYGASMEKEYFHRGNHLFVFEINGFKLSPIICYDIRIPELARTLVIDHGVDAILHCGAYYRDKSFHTWHPFAIARALENQVFFLSLNRAGETYGNSLFCLPWQDETTPPEAFSDREEDFRILTLDRETQSKARRDYTFLQDRLEDYQIELLTS
ncbi:putative carbon-nitrogen hydrolase [Roseobacter sp. SK209-2-6]|uniref:carbon-nitrogen hydrolase family protein n=1 Tax=Roseobacter sp. SK209-2-6 TaxID=388739 RepID=UPI0000F3EB55|nr:carbon-nitrogen hydrolase family protein [Roseobacter sp. SK209-2-6]EBA16804.1 putative carbon-nitrogen hydrolase [Roseobacter sp. SK209-2-6]